MSGEGFGGDVAGILGGHTDVTADVPPNHNPDTGFSGSEAAQADRAQAAAVAQPFETGALPGIVDPTAPAPGPAVEPPAPEDINPELDYGGRGPAYQGISKSTTASE